MTRTVAVVDIGSNSTRLLVAAVDDGRVSELERDSTVTRLGQGVDTGGRLAPDAMQRVYDVLERYRAAIERHGARPAIAVLTSAVRDSANGEEFAGIVRDRYGLEPHVLAGDEEARLTYRGATSERDGTDRTPTLVIDIGGGSTEMVIGEGADVRFRVSTQAGVVRQTERHIHADPPAPGELDELRADARRILAEAVPGSWRTAVGRGIAVAGTATSLGAMAQRLEPYDAAKVHGYRLDAGECRAILSELTRMTVDQRRELPGLHPDRAPTIIAGVTIFLEVLALFDLQEIEVSEHDILRGAALELAGATGNLG